MDVRNLLWRTVPLCFVLCVWLHYVEILVGLEYLPLKQNIFYSQAMNVWSENHNKHKHEACTFEICWRMLMDEGTATVRKITTGIWTGVPLMHKSPCLIYKWFLGLLPRSLYHSTNRLLSDMSEQPLSTLVQRHDSHMVINPGCIFLLIDWHLGSSPYSPDAPRPYKRALCAP